MREKFTIWDAGVYALVIITAALLFIFGAFDGAHGEVGEVAVVTYGGNTARYPLDTDLRETLVSNGYTLTLVIKDGCIFAEEADCPDHTCVKMGKRSRAGDFICCVPAGVYIRIEGSVEDADFISG